MAIFARRTIQRLLDENRAFLTSEQTRRQVDALNSPKAPYQSISFEWEVVIVNAFGKLGNVLHEPDLGASRTIDVVFAPRSELRHFLFADITTVAKRGREKDNPIEYYRRELIRRARKAKLDPDKFGMKVGGQQIGAQGDQVMKLLLPHQRDAKRVFDGPFDLFLKACAAKPDQCHEYANRSDEVELEIAYDPSQRYFAIGGPAFDVAYSRTQNPIFNALKKKADHLKQARARRPSGIAICAADLSLRPSSFANQGGSYDFPAIVNEFFRNHSSVDFVLALEAGNTEYGFGSPPRPRLYSWLYLQEHSANDLTPAMIDCLSTLKDNMPPSINSGINALYQLQDHEPNKGRSFAGGVTMSGNSIKMSSRLLGEILAGRISQEEIGAFHSATRQRPNIFEVFRRRGQTIEGVVIERQDDADDDWITFAFSEGQDPAISKFVAKPKRLDDSESPSE